jgi:hypothetical protein
LRGTIGIKTDNRFNTANIFPAVFTLIAGAVFGGGMIFVTPPFDAPEEYQHFFRGYQCSQGEAYASLNDAGVPGGNLPASLSEVSIAIHSTARNEFEFHVSAEKLKGALSIPLEPGRKSFAGFPSTARFSPLPYLPAAAAMWAGRKLGFSALEELYVGRAGTLAGYLLLVVAAVWLTPIHKWLFSLVALMPMSIFLAASLSADALTIAFSLLSIAMILRLALQSRCVFSRDLAWLGAVLSLLALAKPPYVLIALLFFIVPKDKFAGRGHCWRARAWMICLPIAVGAAWTFSARDLCVPYRLCVDTRGQAQWILANPWHFTKLVVSRITDGYLYSGIIATLGWGTVWLAWKVYYFYWAALLAAAVFDGSQDNVRLPIRSRAISLGTYLLVLTAVANLTYLFWQAVGDEVIHGMQARYFVPVLPLLLLPLRGSSQLASICFSRWLVPVVAMVVVLVGMGATRRAFTARYWSPNRPDAIVKFEIPDSLRAGSRVY